MKQVLINYNINTATTEAVLEHLKKCNGQFVPSLDTKVNLQNYAEKITAFATMFEAWEKELIGLIAAYFNSEKKEVYITNVSIITQFNGRGIASQLMENCVSFAKSGGYREINLRVASGNKSAIGLYSKFGFRHVRFEEDEILMQKELHK